MKISDLTSYADGKILAGCIDNTGYVVINNPERHNAVSLAMYTAAADIVEEMAQDDKVRLLVLQGAGGKAFASGADISKFEKERSSEEQVAIYQAASARFYTAVFQFPKPTLAKITGYCIGGGMALAVCCDMRICEDKSRFAVPAAKLGLGYGFDGVARLSALVGPSMVKEIFYTARQFTAQEAFDMGLVNRVLPSHMLTPYVDDYIQRIAENAPMTMASIKAITQDLQRAEADRNREKIDAMVKACFDSEDYVEGRRAFMEKRKPQFKGR